MRRVVWPMMPLVPLYGVAQALNSVAYARGWRRTERLEWPVVSVGNLSVGGAGKTPFVIALARALTERGWSVDVLSRGYGRTSDGVERVVAADDPAARYGDEPWLIEQRAQVPVFVGRVRAAAGRLAEATLVDVGDARHVHLLDDGMQHRRLARDAEIVLLHRSDFQTTLLPAGRLREPLAALERADFVVLREDDIDLDRAGAPLDARGRAHMDRQARAGSSRAAWSGCGVQRNRAPGRVCGGIAKAGRRDCGDACVAGPSQVYGCGCDDAVCRGCEGEGRAVF